LMSGSSMPASVRDKLDRFKIPVSG